MASLLGGHRRHGIEIAHALRVHVDLSTSIDPDLRSPLPGEWPALLNELDAGLRAGESGRLRSEFPTALDDPDLDLHSVAWVDGAMASHAFARIVDVTADGCTIPFGMVGLVYTDPRFRKRGLAAACVRRCVSRLRRRGVPLAGLWSGLHDFYAELGFEPAGREQIFVLSHSECARVRTHLDPDASFRVDTPGVGDWARLEQLYAAKPCRTVRRSGDLRRLASAPLTRVVVARAGDGPCAYAAQGRGDDFQGVVHEWAGDAAAVAACLAELSRPESLRWLTGPAAEPAVDAFRELGFVPIDAPFARLALLDPAFVWRELGKRPDADSRIDVTWSSLANESGGFALQTRDWEVELTHAESLQLLFGPEPPARVAANLERAGVAVAPWPLFVWGFDSN